MKIKHLIKLLQEQDQELDVFTVRDPEGNGFNKLSSDCLSLGAYDIYGDFTDCQQDINENMKPAICLWP
jgi:hypothetical protein